MRIDSLVVLLASTVMVAQDVKQKIAPDLGETAAEVAMGKRSDDAVTVIVQYSEDGFARRSFKKNALWGELISDSKNMPLSVLRINPSRLAKLAEDPDVEYISPDRAVGATDFAPFTYREVLGYRFTAMTTPERPVERGNGVGIAVIDSGVTADDSFRNASCGSTRIVYNQNFVAGETSANDTYGHGTHVAGIAAGYGGCLPGGADADLLLSGIAPNANIINLRVLNGRGTGVDSAVISAIDRAIALRTTYNIKVINLSLGRLIRESYVNDPLCQAVERAWRAGITVVVAAGNNGRDNSMGTRGYSTITSPGNSPFAITVGATRVAGYADSREDDTVASYSSKGPTLRDRIVKPDLVAPGNVVWARMNPNHHLVSSYQANKLNFIVYSYATVPNLFLLSGTSMASPMVSGSVALLLQKDPTLTNNQIKARLMKTAWKQFLPTANITDTSTGQTFSVQHDMFTVGAGHLNLKAALASTEKPSATRLALSPRVYRSNGVVKYTENYTNLSGGTNVVWGDNVMWGENVVWGDNVLWGENVLWGQNVVWGNTTMSGNNVVWGDNVLWGDSNPFSEALSIRGDR